MWLDRCDTTLLTLGLVQKRQGCIIWAFMIQWGYWRIEEEVKISMGGLILFKTSFRTIHIRIGTK